MRRTAMLMVLVGAVASACSSDGTAGTSTSVDETRNQVAVTATRSAGAASPTTTPAVDRTIRVTITEFQFEPGSFDVSVGETITFEFVNIGAASHTAAIEYGSLTVMSSPREIKVGEAGSITITFDTAGSAHLFDPQPGHEAAGETATIHVT